MHFQLGPVTLGTCNGTSNPKEIKIMKKLKIYYLIFAVTIFVSVGAFSQTTNQWGDDFMGTRLAISITNDTIKSDSVVSLHCTIKNFSTNHVRFGTAGTTGLYIISMKDGSGNSYPLVDMYDGLGDVSLKTGTVQSGESYESIVPIKIKPEIKPGIYTIVALQKIFVLKTEDQTKVIRGELNSNPLSVEVK